MIEAFTLFEPFHEPPEWRRWNWRNRVLKFLTQVWSNDCNIDLDGEDDFPFDTELSFGDVIFWWGRQDFVPYIKKSPITAMERPPSIRAADALILDNQTSSIEAGLIRFIKNNRVKALIIKFPAAEVWLWKKKDRGDLGVWARGLPIGRPDAETDQAKEWLNAALAKVFKIGAPEFIIEQTQNGENFEILGNEPEILSIPANLWEKILERYLVMADISLDYQYAPSAGAIELGIKQLGKFRLNIIATRLTYGYKIVTTVSRIE